MIGVERKIDKIEDAVSDITAVEAKAQGRPKRRRHRCKQKYNMLRNNLYI